MKILIDMNLSPDWCHTFRAAGYACDHWRSIGQINASDPTIMEEARKRGSVLFTHDLDFPTMLWTTRATAPSVVLLRSGDTLPDTMGPRVLLAFNTFKDELARGALLVIDTNRNRVRVLPLS